MKTSWQINPVINGAAQRFVVNQDGYVGLKIAPPFYTGIKSAQYGVFDAANALNIPRIRPRGPSAQAQRGAMVLSNDSFNCKEYPFEMPVDDRQREIYSVSLDADKAAATTAAHIVMTNHEIRVKALIDGSGIANANVGTKWNAAGANPIADADAAKELIRLGCGVTPTDLTTSISVFNVLKEMPSILDKIKYTQKGIVTPDLLAPIFGVSRFNVAGVIENVASEGQATQPADIWGDSVYFSCTNSSQDLMAMNLLRTFLWTFATGRNPVGIKSRRDDDVNSDIHQAFHDADERITGAACGYRLNDVL